MFIVPISSAISPLESVSRVFDGKEEVQDEKVSSPSFLDVFKGIYNNAVDANRQKQDDIISLLLGDADNIEEIQANIAKAEIATDLLVTVKNAAVDTYNEIIKMSI
ncbi:MAG TPA: flagellar hook-basal body complex protein FliE [Ruminococcaceae bacterium]|nr:flagellar hook-basal body complex protein FliE [Oscillospiraceae bacterium]